MTNCLWNSLCDEGELGLCDSAGDAYPILPGDCPCSDYIERDPSMARDQQIKFVNTKTMTDHDKAET